MHKWLANSCLAVGKLQFLLLIIALQEAAPFAVCGSTQILEVRGKKVRGRMYPWGIVEVENPEHCDFIKLRTVLM